MQERAGNEQCGSIVFHHSLTFHPLSPAFVLLHHSLTVRRVSVFTNILNNINKTPAYYQ
jgi:hypothetical protein